MDAQRLQVGACKWVAVGMWVRGWWWWAFLYSDILHARADSLHFCRMWLQLFMAHFFNIHQSAVLTALLGCCIDSAMKNCCCLGMIYARHTTMHLVMSLHTKPHTWGTCMFSCNLPTALLAEWPGSFTCCCGNTGWKGHWNKRVGACLRVVCGCLCRVGGRSEYWVPTVGGWLVLLTAVGDYLLVGEVTGEHEC